MNTVKPTDRELQKEVAELRERITRLETAVRSRQISNREMRVRFVILLLLVTFLSGFAYITIRAALLHN
jgi:hypothetical protein